MAGFCSLFCGSWRGSSNTAGKSFQQKRHSRLGVAFLLRQRGQLLLLCRRIFVGNKEAFALLFAHHMQAEEVGGAGPGARASDDGDDLAGFYIASLCEQPFGALDKGLGGGDLGTTDGGGAPEQVEAIDGDLDGAEGEDRRRRVIL